MKYVYKVTDKNGSSLYGDVYAPYSLRYKIGEKTLPKIGKIFTFKTLALAKRFKLYSEDRIFKCKYDGYAISQKYRAFISILDIERFWRKNKRESDWPVPIGTVTVKSLTPIEEVSQL